MKKLWILSLFLISLTSCGNNLSSKAKYGKYVLSEPIVVLNDAGHEKTLISKIEVMTTFTLAGTYTYANYGGDIIEYRVTEDGIDIWQVYDDYYVEINYRNVELRVMNYRN
ncbi:MAG TPA: hypothetical protein VFD05_04660 [Bacilli bacterium]|nr:hypothetical protein [Bacilli bacterium]